MWLHQQVPGKEPAGSSQLPEPPPQRKQGVEQRTGLTTGRQGQARPLSGPGETWYLGWITAMPVTENVSSPASVPRSAQSRWSERPRVWHPQKRGREGSPRSHTQPGQREKRDEECSCQLRRQEALLGTQADGAAAQVEPLCTPLLSLSELHGQ